MNPKDKPRALGRGLDALLPVAPKRESGGADNGMFICPIEKIVPQKGQPRQHFDAKAIEELSQSIREHGLLQALVVRKIGADKYELIAGERRWRAAQKAGLLEVNVFVKDVSPARAFELALVENVQRADLNPIELAESLDRLMKEHAYTHEALGEALKKDRTTITNALRLLKLPGRIRRFVIDGRLSEGHARALLGAADEKTMEAIADQVVNGRLSVRQTEELVRGARKTQRPPEKPAVRSASVRDVEQRLMRRLGSKVELDDKKGRGRVVVHYGSLDELDRILAIIER